jgi:hypothetical protein
VGAKLVAQVATRTLLASSRTGPKPANSDARYEAARQKAKKTSQSLGFGIDLEFGLNMTGTNDSSLPTDCHPSRCSSLTCWRYWQVPGPTARNLVSWSPATKDTSQGRGQARGSTLTQVAYFTSGPVHTVHSRS